MAKGALCRLERRALTGSNLSHNFGLPSRPALGRAVAREGKHMHWCFCSQNFAKKLLRQGHKIASRSVAPRPPMTDVSTETAFRLDQQAFPKK